MMIKRLFRQHTATVLTIPKPVLAALDMEAGDYVELEVDGISKQIRMSKIVGRQGYDRKNEVGKSEHDRGGGA